MNSQKTRKDFCNINIGPIDLSRRRNYLSRDPNYTDPPDSWFVINQITERVCAHGFFGDPEIVYFYRTDADFCHNRITKMKLGRFIKKVLNIEGEKIIDSLVASWKFQNGTSKISFATKPEHINEVYRDGPSSCMDGNHFVGLIPTHIYGAGDLAVAYIQSSEGRIVARSVCWKKKKIRSTIYGDANLLDNNLRSLGYKFSFSKFIGARLLLLKNVCPYLDFYPIVTRFKNHLKVGKHMGGEYFYGKSEEGLLVKYVSCCECGNGIPPKDAIVMRHEIICKRCKKESLL